MIDRSGPGRRRAGCVRRVLVLAPVLALAFPVPPLHAAEIGPNDNLCAAIEALQPGDELLLGAGDYKAGCTIRRGGRPDSPVTIAAADPTHRPRLVYPGQPVNMLEIRASDVVIRGLDFWGAMADADGVRIISGNRITVEDCRFTQLGGIAIAA